MGATIEARPIPQTSLGGRAGKGVLWGFVCGGCAGVVVAVGLATYLGVIMAIFGESNGGDVVSAVILFILVAGFGSVVGFLTGGFVGLVIGFALGAAGWERSAKWVAAAAASGLPIAIGLAAEGPIEMDGALYVLAIAGVLATIGYMAGITFERKVGASR